ncbi:NACHT, LRR and PYD domains-containing protein 3-like isoform X2 [Alosa pseudoharengus]|uniref:NACHT, LRR and PYD domains-containing protein 3-like isoform X2 n=1 Tax=Alosa pseudoharengus TaxID=34774 RepID=UPI003F8C0222
MSVSQETEEATGHSETLTPESSLPTENDKGMDDYVSTHTDAGLSSLQMKRIPSPVPSHMSVKTNRSMSPHPHFSNESAPSSPNLQMKRIPSPVPSHMSVNTNRSMSPHPHFSNESAPSSPNLQMKRIPSPVPSHMSVKTNRSMGPHPDFSNESAPSSPNLQMKRIPSPVPSHMSVKTNRSMGPHPDFSNESAPSSPKQCISSHWEQPGLLGDQACPQCGKTCRTQPSLQRPVETCKQRHSQYTQVIRTNIDDGVQRDVEQNHKAILKRKFEGISECINKPDDQRLLKEIYIELYITEGEREGENKEHEVWQVESASRTQTTEDTPINCNDIFKPLPGQERHIRTVMTKGVAGIGKTVSVQKFILDWVDGEANHNINFIIPLSFRELNLVRDDVYSLQNLLTDFHPELKKLNSEEYTNGQIVFIFDGLDESRISLNFHEDLLVSDVKQVSPLDVLISSLIQGTLLPSALIWITSRPAAGSQIPACFIDQFTEVRGFNDPQKEEYFRKRISDVNQANRIIAHIKASRSLHIMCHIPVFCWIAATVLQQMLERDSTQEIPKTLTELFIHFLLIQTTRMNQKYESGTETNEEKQSQSDIILKLAELAYNNLENGNLMFYEEDLRDCGIDVDKAIKYSGMCTEIFKEESMFHQRKVFCFVHLSIQEFLAALHAFVSYSCLIRSLGSLICLEGLLKLAISKVLESRNGHLDLFLRFLLGICLESNQILLQDFLDCTHNSSGSIKKMSQYIKEINKEDLSPERCISLLQCLFEMNDHSIHDEIKEYNLKSPEGIRHTLSPTHCSALAQMLLMSEEVLDDFDLKRYNTSDEGRRRLLPVLSCFRTAHLDGCKLSGISCETVTRSLQSPNSLMQLDLSHNAIGDSGVQLLSAGLTSPHCKLQILRLADCNISGKSCEIVTCLLQPGYSLIEVDLSHNDLEDPAIHHLSKGLVSPDSKLEILRLSGCLISEEGCSYLASALTSNHSSLKELDLSYNHLGESGQKLLSARLEDPDCELKTLKMDHCAEMRLRPGVQKYACDLSLDPNTAHRDLCLSEENRKVVYVTEKQDYPDNTERFDCWPQVLCREGLSGRCYWEAEWSGNGADVAVAYKSMQRKEGDNASMLGYNNKSWNLECSNGKYTVKHNNENTDIPAPSSCSNRVGVYLDWPAGILSFYSISSNTHTHLHTVHSTFVEPLYPGFYVWPDSPVSLCQIT